MHSPYPPSVGFDYYFLKKHRRFDDTLNRGRTTRGGYCRFSSRPTIFCLSGHEKESSLYQMEANELSISCTFPPLISLSLSLSSSKSKHVRFRWYHNTCIATCTVVKRNTLLLGREGGGGATFYDVTRFVSSGLSAWEELSGNSVIFKTASSLPIFAKRVYRLPLIARSSAAGYRLGRSLMAKRFNKFPSINQKTIQRGGRGSRFEVVSRNGAEFRYRHLHERGVTFHSRVVY